MRKRAEQIDQTRQRIIDAAVHLHGTVGPAETTIAGIAREAGTTRLTVYRHFADEEAIFAACSAHWLSRQVQPKPDEWVEIADPIERVRAGLTDLYRFYRDGGSMLTRIHRDLAALPAGHRHIIVERDQYHRDVLLDPFRAGTKDRRLRAVLAHAVAFGTWRSLCIDNKLSDSEAVEAMTALVAGTAAATAAARDQQDTGRRRPRVDGSRLSPRASSSEPAPTGRPKEPVDLKSRNEGDDGSHSDGGVGR